MSFKKIVGIVQIISSMILVAIPIGVLFFVRKAIDKWASLSIPGTYGGIEAGLSIMPLLNAISMVIVIIIIFNALIALSLILQGIVNIKK